MIVNVSEASTRRREGESREQRQRAGGKEQEEEHGQRIDVHLHTLVAGCLGVTDGVSEHKSDLDFSEHIVV